MLQRSANRILPPTSSEAARATLSKCFQKAWTGSRSTPSLAKPVRTEPPPEQPERRECEEEVQYSLADPFAGINPVPRQSDQLQHGRTASRADPPRTDYPLEEKKRRSSSRPCGVVEPKRGRSSGAEPSWNVSQIGSRQTGKPQSQPSSGPEPPEPKLKSIVKSVRLSLPKPVDLESLGPARRKTGPGVRDPGIVQAHRFVQRTCRAASRVPIKARNDPTVRPVGMIGSPVKAPATSPRRMRV